MSFWQLFFTTFGTVFLAELGDKTQLATLSFASGGHSKWAVFFGSAGALVATSALAVVGASWLQKMVSPEHLKLASGVLFIVLGVLILWKR